MYSIKDNKVYASEIAKLLNYGLCGKDFLVTGFCALDSPRQGCVTFSKTSEYLLSNKPNVAGPLLVICSRDINDKDYPFSIIHSHNPKLSFIRVIEEFFAEKPPNRIHPQAIIDKDAKISTNVAIGANSIIGKDVEIGANTIIMRNVVISGKVRIGENCVIKDNSTIGSEAFNFERDEAGTPIHFPQLGEIIIGNFVWLGSNSTIERPPINETVIKDYVQIDDLVQVGHDCNIGQGTTVAAGTMLGGSVRVEENCTIFLNVSVKPGLTIGDNAVIGMGSAVIKDVAPNTTVAGNPARELEKKAG